MAIRVKVFSESFVPSVLNGGHELPLIDHEYPLIIFDNWLREKSSCQNSILLFMIIRDRLMIIRAETAP